MTEENGVAVAMHELVRSAGGMCLQSSFDPER